MPWTLPCTARDSETVLFVETLQERRWTTVAHASPLCAFPTLRSILNKSNQSDYPTKKKLSAMTQRVADDRPDGMRVVISPYRICPIGAHSDHQGGPTLGMAVSAHSVLTFAAQDSPAIHLESDNFPGAVDIDSSQVESVDECDGWGRYVAAAALVLRQRLPRSPVGIRGRIYGTLPGGGLSSSASVLLAYLTALAEVNGVVLSPTDKAELALRAERELVGIKVGILDPAAIVGSRRGHLLAIDSRANQWEAVPLGEKAPPFQIVVAATGVTRNLAGTSYNNRVEECFAACEKLADFAGRSDVVGLHDLDDAVFEEFGERLPRAELLRARHFFTERARVRRGIELWREGDLEGFGALMNASCQSSIENWESGSPELIEVQRKLEATEGVYGSRFSGAGFGGCVVAFAKDVDVIKAALPLRVFAVESDDGVRVL